VEATGLFADACHDWRKKAEAEQTLDAFKLDFSAADTKHKRQTTNSNTAGFHGANAVRTVAATPAATSNYRAASTLRNFHYCWSQNWQGKDAPTYLLAARSCCFFYG
jgi:site-specific recombinase XerD